MCSNHSLFDADSEGCYFIGDKDMPYKITIKVMEGATEAGAIDTIFGTLRA